MSEANLTGSNSRVKQKTYGSLRYDERTGELIVMTTEDSASGHYRYNWTHFVNPETGEIVRTIALRPYYWFQSFAIFPDKHDAVIALEDIAMDVSDDAKVIEFSDLVSDADNVDANIKVSLVDEPSVLADDASKNICAEVTLKDDKLVISPISAGEHSFTLAAESNGRVVSKTIHVKVGDASAGIEVVGGGSQSVVCDGHRLIINGFDGSDFEIFDVAGRKVAAFNVDSDAYIFDFGVHSGVYLVVSGQNFSTKVIVR